MNRRSFIKLLGATAAALSLGVTGSVETEAVIYTSLYRDERLRANVLRAVCTFRGRRYGLEMVEPDEAFFKECMLPHLIRGFLLALREAGVKSWRDGGIPQ